MEAEVLKRYFQNGMKQVEIAKELNISKCKVSRIVTRDARYQEEKERRKLLSKQQHKEKTMDYIKKTRNIKRQNDAYQQLQQMHIQASLELSGRRTISNRAFRKWNSSIYQYNKKTNAYHLKKGIVTGFDVPKKIKM